MIGFGDIVINIFYVKIDSICFYITMIQNIIESLKA